SISSCALQSIQPFFVDGRSASILRVDSHRIQLETLTSTRRTRSASATARSLKNAKRKRDSAQPQEIDRPYSKSVVNSYAGRHTRLVNPLRTITATAGGIITGLINLLSTRSSVPRIELKAGDVAPDFSLVGSDGGWYRLSGFRGTDAVVLAWFP